MPYNLGSRKTLTNRIDTDDPYGWFARETLQVEREGIRQVLQSVAKQLHDFVRWPDRAILLWDGCDRKIPEGARHRYHRYPEAIKKLAMGPPRVTLDGRPNGPAIASFLLAGGSRPERFGSSNSWSIHHVYSGKFPYVGHFKTTHAIKECKHFTQSAGLIAAHPIADGLCDEFPFFAWLLRFEAFRRFEYDPDGAFCDNPDAFGFVNGNKCEVVIPVAEQKLTLAG
jgi:hypothetical protein